MSDKPKGLRLDPLENVADGIEKLFCLFGDGVDVGSRTTISADRSVSCMLYLDGDEVVLSFDEPEPTVRVSILSGELSAIRIGREKISVVLEGLPDVSMEVKS